MAETGDLIIKIGGDASKFKATIADVENSLKSFKANLGESGLNIKIEALGFQEAKSNIKGVADFAEGTLGAIKNTIKEVKAERLTISADPNSLAPFNIKLNELNTTVKELEKAGILKNVPQEAAVAANSLQGLSN
jgi:DNA repair ATPase RecN